MATTGVVWRFFSMLKHIVLFAFKDDADPAEIEAIFQRFAWLRTVMPEIRSFSWGKFNGTPVMPRHGYNHGFEMEFESEARTPTLSGK